MRKLKRLKVDELVTFCQLTEAEMDAMVGGTGCCWDALSCAVSDFYGQNVSPSYFKTQWESWLALAREQGCNNAELGEYGDPTMEQTGFLLGFIQQFFETSPSWALGKVPIEQNASYGFAIMKGDDSSEEHAILVIGYDYASANLDQKYYRAKDPMTGETFIVGEDQIIGGLSLKGKTIG